MFGYITVNPEELSKQQLAQYRGYYCGLCRALGQRHGAEAKVCLTYDMTFLVVLLTSLYEYDSQAGRLRCLPHPLKEHDYLYNAFTDYAADMSVALSYYNLMDNWKDSRDLASLSLARRLKKRYLSVAQKYPRQCTAIHYCLAQLEKCEKADNQNLDEVSGCFGCLLGEILDARHDVWSRDLKQMGFALGKFIYLMDAYEDLPGDKKAGRYNPLRALAGQEGYEEKIHDILELLMAQCAAAFERLPVLENADLLRNILYSGVWMHYRDIRHKRAAKEESEGENH